MIIVNLHVDAGGAFRWAVELSGGASVILPIFHCEGAPYIVLVEQVRTSAGRRVIELPAGKLDDDSYLAAAIREVWEELEIEIQGDELVDLTALLLGADSPEIFSSPGLGDERVRIFLLERQVTRPFLEQLAEKRTGVAVEGESIILHVIPFNDVTQHTRDMKTFAALYLYGLYQARAMK